MRGWRLERRYFWHPSQGRGRGSQKPENKSRVSAVGEADTPATVPRLARGGLQEVERTQDADISCFAQQQSITPSLRGDWRAEIKERRGEMLRYIKHDQYSPNNQENTRQYSDDLAKGARRKGTSTRTCKERGEDKRAKGDHCQPGPSLWLHRQTSASTFCTVASTKLQGTTVSTALYCPAHHG